jgi:hypothetical protein
MGMWVIVRFHLVFQILDFFLQPLDLFFKPLDSLVIIGMLMALLGLGHVSSLQVGDDRNTDRSGNTNFAGAPS